MLRTENMTINGKQYIRTWSDIGMMIERDGALYEEAIDPTEFERIYAETDKVIQSTEEEND